MNKDKKINDFIVFCIEWFKTEYNLTGEETYKIFKKYNVLGYLKDGYEVLHTMGKDWIINDIYEYLKIRDFNL